MHVATDYAGRQISIHKRSKASGLVCLSRGREGRHAPSGPRPCRIRFAYLREHQPSATSEQALAKDRVASHLTGVQSVKGTTRPTSSYQTGARALLIVAHDVVKKGESRSPPQTLPRNLDVREFHPLDTSMNKPGATDCLKMVLLLLDI